MLQLFLLPFQLGYVADIVVTHTDIDMKQMLVEQGYRRNFVYMFTFRFKIWKIPLQTCINRNRLASW